MAAATPTSALAVVEQDTETGVVEWNLDSFPSESFNRLLPTQTLAIPTDLLRPVVQVVQLNPDPKAGDVYHSDDMPAGQSAPTKVALRKFATAAGISIVDERRTDDGRDPNVVEVTCVAEMLMPTGQRLRATGMKRIDLDAQKWASDNHRLKFKSFFQEHVSSRAQNRAIRALLSLKGSYPDAIYQRPFAVVSFAPNMAHPEVRARILDAMTGSAAALYGPADQKSLTPGQAIDVTPAAEDDPAPSTPPVMPGERLAAAQGSDVAGDDALPAWATDQPAADAEPTLLARIRDTAEAGGMVGGAKKPQLEALGEIFGPLKGRATVGGLQALWPDMNVNAPTANQAQAVIGVSRQYESPEAFQAAWREMAGIE